MRQHTGSHDMRYEPDEEAQVFDPEARTGPETDREAGEPEAAGPALSAPATVETGATEPDGRLADPEARVTRGSGRGVFGSADGRSTAMPLAGDVPPSDRDPEDLPGSEVTAGSPDGPALTSDLDGRSDQGHLVPADATERLRDQWRDAQTMFVDDPSESLARARTLLAEFVHLMARQIDERGRQRSDASTEDLRLELRQYRRVFDQLVEA